MMAFTRAPHMEGAPQPVQSSAPNAALLIDFDNVTMGMRSDLSKELKNLLNSDVIRGKVTVQRAYADWRRYPQYIVPLSEASIDLIFAPAYGSSKKNATDIRMAIDGMELIFIRPEIGTYILLTGDSDFSSLVLKLKEYGKYVIGVGIQESSSDILVQNCDEYYSYTALTGLRKTTDTDTTATDPWVLIEKALEQMVKRKDVMRSDRLKQVMLEIDQGFDEASFGFSKFSRFLSEASSKNLVRLKRLENGQYEVYPTSGRGAPSGEAAPAAAPRRPSSGRGSRGGRSSSRSSAGAEARTESPQGELSIPDQTQQAPIAHEAEEGIEGAWSLLRQAIEELGGRVGGDAVRDSDIKRKMLAIDASFDEAEHGFSKFSLFLRQAHDDGLIELRKGDNGNYEVELRAAGAGAPQRETAQEAAPSAEEPGRDEEVAMADEASRVRERAATPAPSGPASGRRLTPRTSRRRGADAGPPPLLEGQAVGLGGTPSAKPSGDARKESAGERAAPASNDGGSLPVEEMNLPTDPDAVVRYLTNSYAGVGKKTAESLVEAFGDRLFPTFHSDPDRVAQVIPARRAEKVLEGWRSDYERRQGRAASQDDQGEEEKQPAGVAAGSETPGAGDAAGAATGGASDAGADATPSRPARRGGRRTRGGRGSSSR
ncbi:MAG: NYN domain-containing protein [Gemmatimonadota bacterium]